MIDITGERYGRLVVIEEVERRGKYGRRWLCRCDCGNEKIVAMNQLRTGKTKSCGCLNREITSATNTVDLTGRRFGKLTVIKRSTEKHHTHRVMWECRCDCGNVVNVVSSYLVHGETKSCGCYKVEFAQGLQQHNEDNWFVDGVFVPLLKSKLRTDNTSGVKGVTWNPRTGKHRASIVVKGKRYYLGEYATREEAAKARERGEKKYHLPHIEEIEEKSREER